MRRTACIVWTATSALFVAISAFGAVKLTAPAESKDVATIALLYTKSTDALKSDPGLRFFEGDGAAFELHIQPKKPPITMLFAISDGTDCLPTENLESSAARVDQPVIFSIPKGKEKPVEIPAFVLNVATDDVQFTCHISKAASKEAFAIRRFTIAANPRYVDSQSDDGSVMLQTAMDLRTVTYHPLRNYRLEFGDIAYLDDARIDGGQALGSPTGRRIVDSSAQVRVRWKNDVDDHWRELMLFLAAGVFALGLATGLEAIKAALETGFVAAKRDKPHRIAWASAASGSKKAGATPAPGPTTSQEVSPATPPASPSASNLPGPHPPLPDVNRTQPPPG